MENQLINVEELTIEIMDSGVQRTAGSMLAVGAKGRVSLSDAALIKLDVEAEEYLIFGKVGDYNLVAKRPIGKGLNGYVIKKPKKSNVHFVGSLSLRHIPKGKYNFGDAVYKDDFVWHPLVKAN